MSFQPVVPFGGYAGWAFLQRTRESQEKAFNESPSLQRNTDYFRENIGSVTSADELVSDRRLLSVALDAFGLGDDINNKFFIKKVLEDGTQEPTALANRLSDKRYLEFSKAFGFGDFEVPNTVLSDFPDTIIERFQTQRFEAAIGEQNEDLRLAAGTKRELSNLLEKQISDDGLWYTVMGTPPLRKMFEAALGLPSSFGALDIDQQLSTFREKAERVFGDSEVRQFSEPEKQDKLIRMFLIRSEIDGGFSSPAPGSVALSILRGGN